MDFERKLFIKNLYNSNMILNEFDTVHFENLMTFNKCLMNNLYRIEKEKTLKITLKDICDYNNLLKIMKETDLCKKTNVIIHINKQEALEDIMNNLVPLNFSIECNENLEVLIKKYWNKGKDWIRHNRLYKRISLNANNFDEKINKIISTFNKTLVRFFVLDIDFESFDELKLKDLNKLKFWLHHLRSWMMEEKAKIAIKRTGFNKIVFVTEDLKLYLNDKKNDIWSWDLESHMNKTGEDIPYKELNRFRMYMDLHPKAMYGDYGVSSWSFIDFEQCLKMTGNINEIPLIMILFGRWLYESL